MDTARILESLCSMDGFLIDLDGTIYDPESLLPGVKQFFDFLIKNQKKFVFLSNTGAKGSSAIQQKFQHSPFLLSPDPLPLHHFFSATEAAISYLHHNIQDKATLYIVQGETKLHGDFIDILKGNQDLLEKVDIFSSHGNNGTTKLNESIAKRLCEQMAVSGLKVYVIFAHDGPIDDPDTPQVEDWNFEIFKFSHWLISNGATFVNTASDATNSAPKSNTLESLDFSIPGPGSFEAMIHYSTFPKAKDRWVNVGKGGKEGNKFMMEAGIQLLIKQGHSGDREKIVMIGDRLDTDIAGGHGVGIKTLLVESGIHKKEHIPHYNITPNWILPGLLVFKQ